jgi:dimethylargininase
MFTRAIVRTPGADAADGLTSAGPGRPDLRLLLRQHTAYVATLRQLGLQVEQLEPLAGHPDAYFVEDAALIFPELAVATRPGADARRAEADALAPVLATHRPVHRLLEPATLDGGDVLALGKTVFVGLGGRTNREGASQLAALLAPHDYHVVPVRVPQGLHLKSGVTAAGEDVVLLTEPFAALPELAGHRHLLVPADESYAANVLCINGTIVMPRGFPRTQALLEKTGTAVITLDQSEVRKMDGALTCLSLRF